MGRFYPLYLRRSDGQLEVTNHHKRKERNEPTPDQLDRKPDANGVSDYYREVPMDEQKHLDWRRKLGGLLARDLGWSDTEKGYMLAAFPEHYRLFEHVKTAGGEKQSIKTGKTHAGGGNERQDAYLYGHPMGRKKRYRSPADFYAHLYWLATDESGDPDNCACKICTPEEFDEPKTLPVKKEVKQEPVKQEVKEEAIKREPSLSATARQANTQPAPTPTPTQAHAQAQTSQSRSLPAVRNQDQATDLTYNAFIFRSGELVWFSRGHAWGLGIITRRWKEADARNAVGVRKYTVQPLSHPYGQSQQTTVTGDESLRPWLAWSVPAFTCDGLNKISVTYETADWNSIFQHKYGSGDFEVDGSILAAKAIDPTYTTLDLISRTEIQPGLNEYHWNGLYLGAEKIWLSDIVRLRTGNGLDILVVRDILERTRTSAFNSQVLDRSLVLIGDTYTLSSIQSTDPTRLPPGTDTTALPPRLLEDLRHRNARTVPAKNIASTYRLSRQNTSVPTRDIKGRWYEATLLHPILNPGYEAEFARGEVVETGTRMNSRLDCNVPRGMTVAAVQEVRKMERKDAIGKAMPAGVGIADGSSTGANGVEVAGQNQSQNHNHNHNHNQQQNSIQHQAPVQGQGQSQQVVETTDTHTGDTAGLDEFMDLDGIGAEDLPGFGQDYGGQGF